MRLSNMFILLTVAASLTGCAIANTRSGSALVTSVKEAGIATMEKAGSKRGEACQHNILGIANIGDSSIDSAKKTGSIEVVSSVDYDVLSVGYFYAKVCTIVKGN